MHRRRNTKHTGIRQEKIRKVGSKARKQEIVLKAFIVTNLPDSATTKPSRGSCHTIYHLIPTLVGNGIKYHFFSFFFPSYLLSSPFCSLSLLVVTQTRSHIAGSFPPIPTTVRALHFYREKISALSSLVDSRRNVLTHARRS